MAESLQLVAFEVEDQLFGINIEDVREIIRPLNTITVPETQQWLDGLVELRGKVIPIIDLRTYFSFPRKDIEQKRTVVIEVQNKLVGLNVDLVEGIAKVSASQIDDCPESAARDYIKGIVRNEGKIIIFLDIDKLLSVDDLTNLKPMLNDIKEY